MTKFIFRWMFNFTILFISLFFVVILIVFDAFI